MKTIFLPKVYETLNVRGNDGRVIGWFPTYKDAEEGLQNFGDECRWSYAVIEEIGQGMHGVTYNAFWFAWADNFNSWVSLEKDFTSDFMLAINHTIG